MVACRAEEWHASSAEQGCLPGSGQSTVNKLKNLGKTVNDSLLVSVLLVEVAAGHIFPVSNT